jgi:hypothetical protein
MFHETHSAVARPTLFVVVAYNVFVVGVRVLCEVALYEITGLLFGEAEDHVQFVNIPAV